MDAIWLPINKLFLAFYPIFQVVNLENLFISELNQYVNNECSKRGDNKHIFKALS